MGAGTGASPVAILLVGDRDADWSVMEGLRGSQGVDFVWATSADETLALLRKRDWALVFLELQAKGIDGIALARAIHRQQASRHIPVVFIVGAGLEGVAPFLDSDDGPVDCLSRPLDPEAVRRKVTLFCCLQERCENARRRLEELERLFRERTVELERRNQDIERFAVTVAHSLQAPLDTIAEHMERVVANGKTNGGTGGEEFSSYFLSRALDTAHRMKHLIGAVLRYTRIEEGAKAFEPVDLKCLVQEVIADLDHAVHSTGAQIDVRHLPEVQGNPDLLRELFENLLDNAIKFCDATSPEIRIAAEAREGYWVFAVTDNGIGMASDDLAHVFQMFRRGRHEGCYPGHGIGLALCERIVEHHGGALWAESSPGNGSTFYFTIPVAPERTAVWAGFRAVNGCEEPKGHDSERVVT